MFKPSWAAAFRWPLRASGVLRGGRRVGVRTLVAALLTLLVVLGASQLADHPRRGSEYVLTTDVGEHRTVTLPDGAELALNTATTINVRSTRHAEEIELTRGEVSIDSTKRGTKRHRLAAGGVIIETTQANVSIRRDTDDTYTVRIFAGDGTMSPFSGRTHGNVLRTSFTPVRLETGRSAVIKPGKVVLSTFKPENARRMLAWKQGMLIFENETVADVVAEVNRYNRSHIIVDDPVIAQLRIGGAFRTTDLGGLVYALESTFHLRAVSKRSGGSRASVILLARSKADRAPMASPSRG